MPAFDSSPIVQELNRGLLTLSESFGDLREMLEEIQRLTAFLRGESLVLIATNPGNEETLSQIHSEATEAHKRLDSMLLLIPAVYSCGGAT